MGKFFKQASRLRKALQIVRLDTQDIYKGHLARFSADLSDYRIYLKRSGKFVGNILISRSKLGGPPRVVYTQVTEKFRGMGLGKRLYGEVIMREGNLVPGKPMSEDAQRVWKSLYKRYPQYEKGVSGA